MIVMVVVFSCANISAMNVDQRIAKLKCERTQLLNKIEKKAGGNSTMTYRWLSKAYQPELNKYK
jgi:hypothetical protein